MAAHLYHTPLIHAKIGRNLHNIRTTEFRIDSVLPVDLVVLLTKSFSILIPYFSILQNCKKHSRDVSHRCAHKKNSSQMLHCITELPGYPTTWLYPTIWLPNGYPTTWLPNYLATPLPNYLTTQLPGYPTTSLPNYLTTALPGYPITWPDYMTIDLPNYCMESRTIPKYCTGLPCCPTIPGLYLTIDVLTLYMYMYTHYYRCGTLVWPRSLTCTPVTSTIDTMPVPDQLPTYRS